MNEIWVAIITGAFSLIGIIITCSVTNSKTRADISNELRESQNDLKQEFKVSQAVTNTKIEELTREVREHNNFAKRMPVVENEIKHIKSDINKYHG
jgi:hypothetical protein